MTNESMAANWANGARGWVENERIFDSAFRPVTEAILLAAELGSARRVLDVGCGAGTLLEAAVAAGVEAVGVDISPGMTEAAQRRVPEATLVTADAQTTDLLAAAPGDPFDRVVSRFGVMFFADPAAAFANIRAACAPGALLAFACWREGEVDQFTVGNEALRARMTDPPPVPAPGAPGPLGLANEEQLREVLSDAGWSEVALDPRDPVFDYSIDGSDGVEQRLAVALSGNLGRTARAALEPEMAPHAWAALLDEARAEIRRRITDGPVRLTGKVWIVTARAPH
jgi:SAM-dependent methyltransferase